MRSQYNAASLRLVFLVLVGPLANPWGASGQFYMRSISVGERFGHDQYSSNGALAATSMAVFSGNSPTYRQAVQSDLVELGGYYSGPGGTTIFGPFRSNQGFTCGPYPSGHSPFSCAGTRYYTKPLCPTRYSWSAGAAVSTQRGVWWVRDSTTTTGMSSCWVPLPPEPPTCSGGSQMTEYIFLPLDGLVSARRPDFKPPAPLTNYEEVGGESFFVNDYAILERHHETAEYVVVNSFSEPSEAIEVVRRSTPHSTIAPGRVLAIKVARHQRAVSPLKPVEPSFGAPLLLPDSVAPVQAGGEGGESTWRFAAEFDVRDALGLSRESRVLWAERHVPELWLQALTRSLELSGNPLEHRLLVYAVVEVRAGDGATQVRVEQYRPVVPQCCCGSWICL